MPIEIRMPRLTDSMTEGVVVAWRKSEGEPVRAGEVIAEERRDLGTARSLKAAKAIAMSDWAKRSVISTDPLLVMKPTVLEWKSVTPDLEASFLFQRLLQ